MTAEDPDIAFDRKISRKFALRRTFGELYVGKRMKMHALRRVLPTLAPPPGGRVLEVGSEDGCFTEWLDRCWPQATLEGLEMDPAHARATARWAVENGRAPKLTFRHGDLLTLGGSDTYDLIFCLDVLGYIRDDEAAIRRLAGALKPGGRLVVHQPNIRYREFSGRTHYVTPEEAGKITEGHVRHGYGPEDLSRLLESAGGLRVERLETWHGPFSDLAHRVYRFLERPAFLRLAALPLIDLLWLIDHWLPRKHGNTVFAVATKKPAAG